MRRFRRNSSLAEALQRNPTLDLPLFADQNRTVSRRDKLLARQAPRAVEVATPTRNLAYKQLTYDPEALSEKQRLVFEEFCKYEDATNEEIRVSIGWEINRVCGRTPDLREMGLIVPAERRRGVRSLATLCRRGGWRD